MSAEVLVDTSVWVEYLRGHDAALAKALDALLEEDKVATCGVVAAALMQGARSLAEMEELQDGLKGLHWLDVSAAGFEAAGRLSFSLRKKGRAIPLTDVLIAVLAQESGCAVWSQDKHFAGIPGLELWKE